MMLYQNIISHFNDVRNINFSISLLNWDLQTYIPKNGYQSRALCVETLSKKSYEMQTSDEFFGHLVKLISSSEFNDLSLLQQKEIQKIYRNTEKLLKVPKALVAELAKTASEAMNIWAEARKNNDDKHFLPILDKIFKLKKEQANYIGFKKNPYDALLDDFESGLEYNYIEAVFSPLKKELSEFIKEKADGHRRIKDDFLYYEYDAKKQIDFGLRIVSDMGLSPDDYRQDFSAHPFTSKIGLGDVRITTNISEDDLKKGFFSTIHEAGHCLYETNAGKKLSNGVFSDIDLLALHESQSRFYENIIARSFSFWKNYFPELKKAFSKNLNDVSVEDFYASINKIEKNPIRIESDEVTYNLHIVLRTELENEIINGKIDVLNINEAWNEKTKELFGFYPANKSEGYLQDIHWSDGLIGYFPTYTIGNLIAGQLNFFMQKEIGNFEIIDRDVFKKIFNWMNKNVHEFGSEFKSSELIQRICGEKLDSKYFLNYIYEKFKNL